MKWKQYLRISLRKLLAKPTLLFRDMKPSDLPETKGVYVISAKNKFYYVGRTKNFRQRIYNNHLMGPLTNARLKKYLIISGECTNKQAAKQFLRKHASVQWLEQEDMRTRAFLECYFTAILTPKHGISEEH